MLWLQIQRKHFPDKSGWTDKKVMSKKFMSPERGETSTIFGTYNKNFEEKNQKTWINRYLNAYTMYVRFLKKQS